jgi:hypothetical protein
LQQKSLLSNEKQMTGKEGEVGVGVTTLYPWQLISLSFIFLLIYICFLYFVNDQCFLLTVAFPIKEF